MIHVNPNLKCWHSSQLAHPIGSCTGRMRFGVLQVGVPTCVPHAALPSRKPSFTGDNLPFGQAPDQPERSDRRTEQNSHQRIFHKRLFVARPRHTLELELFIAKYGLTQNCLWDSTDSVDCTDETNELQMLAICLPGGRRSRPLTRHNYSS